MVGSTASSRSTSRYALPPAAAGALVALLPVALMGCSQREFGRFVEGLALVILALVVVAAAIYGFVLLVLVTNLVQMLRKKPSLGWGITSCVCGGLVALSSIQGLFSARAGFPHLGSLFLAVALGWVGYKNVRDAQRLAAERDADVAIPPPAAPPPGTTPPPEQPPRTLAPPWP